MSLPKTYLEGFHDLEAVKKMKYKRFGNTDMELSMLSFGGGGLSGFYEEFQESDGVDLVKSAVKEGINYIDTAPYYGEGRSETCIGKALRDIPRQTYYISTKVGRYALKLENMFDYSPRKIKSRFETSLQLLGIEYVDIIILHDVEFAKMKDIQDECLPVIKEIIDSGKARYLGISGYPLSRIWDVVQRAKIHIDLVLTYSRDTLLDSSLRKYFPLFKGKDLGVINAAPTALQMLTNAGPQPWHPADEETKQICAKATCYCKEQGVELGRIAVYHAFVSPVSETVLVGMNSSFVLRQNLDLLINGLTTKEKQVYDYLIKNILTLSEDRDWEGRELKQYNMKME